MIRRTSLAIMTLLCVACSAPEAVTPAPNASPEIIALYPSGAPGFEDRKDLPERAEEWWVRDIHAPTLTYLPAQFGAQSETGTPKAAVIILPGGGHENLVFKSEGLQPAAFLSEQGLHAFALKYRLARQAGSDYRIEEHAAEDLRQSLIWVRENAQAYNIDPNRVGVMGFSAGGELVNLVTYAAQGPVPAATRPDFQIQIYPGPIGVPNSLNSAPPPGFFLGASDDRQAADTIRDQMALYASFPEVPIEVHLFAQGGHAFNMGDRSDLATISDWPA